MNTQTRLQMADDQVLQKAIGAFHHQTGLQLQVRETGLAMANREIDTVIEIEGNQALRFTAEIKKWVQQANIGAVLEQVRQLPGKGMLVADYVNPNMADKMRELQIPFIDAAGNAYINEQTFYVFIKGNKQEKIEGAGPRGRAFKPTGVKVIHALLTHPELVNATYREIKNVAGVAIGTIGWVLHDLKEAGYLLELHNGEKRLEEKKKLLDRWVEAYLEKLRPRQLVGRFTTEDKDWWKHVDLTMYGAKWGGEVAAAKMTDYLRPEKITIYLPQNGGKEIFKDARFRKDEFGEITVYRAFWNDNIEAKELMHNTPDLVDPLVVYADLLATADVRNMETAHKIYGEEIARLIKGD